jgi:hypothetical protein
MTPPIACRLAGFAGLAALALLTTACQGPASSIALPAGAVPIPTSKVVKREPCTLEAAVTPVRGVLDGDATNTTWPVWLSSSTGEHLFVQWPRGWSARFDPTLSLLDESGNVRARSGTGIVLGQVPRESAAGTVADPYVARGLFLDGCFGPPG